MHGCGWPVGRFLAYLYISPIGYTLPLHSGISPAHSPLSWHSLMARLQFPGQMYVATLPNVVSEKLTFPGNPEIFGDPQSTTGRKLDQRVSLGGYTTPVMCMWV